MKTLDEWEAAEKRFVESRVEYSNDRNIQSRRILKLIELIRKKDEALKKLTRIPTHQPDIVQINPIAEEALAETERMLSE